MGIFRTLYREARDILGLKPPPENGTQRAERMCGEVKNDFPGKKAQDGDNYVLSTTVDGRETTLLFEAEPSRARVAMVAAVDEALTWAVERDPLAGAEPVPAGTQRTYVASGIYAEGPAKEVARLEALWKQLPTGARGLVSQLVGKMGGRLEVEGAVVTFTPEVETLDGKSARYTVRSHVQSLKQIVEGMESGWA